MLQLAKTDRTFDVSDDGQWVGKCLHCGSRIENSTATVEHIVPRARGGSGTDLLNMALACARCNNEKGIRHDPAYPKDARSVEVINNLLRVRAERWRPTYET